MLFKVSEGTAPRRRLLVYLVDDTDGKTAETGVTVSAGDIKISKNGAAEANHAGTWTEIAGGLYYYEYTSGELDTLGFVTFRIVKTGVRTFVGVAQVVSLDPYVINVAGIKKNTALNAFEFPMFNGGGDLVTGETITAQRTIDGGAIASCANAASEVGTTGIYKID